MKRKNCKKGKIGLVIGYCIQNPHKELAEIQGRKGREAKRERGRENDREDGNGGSSCDGASVNMCVNVA